MLPRCLLALCACSIACAAVSAADEARAEGPSQVAGRTLDEWTAELSSETRTARLRAVLTLPAFDAAAVPALTEALAHDDPAVRYWAASGLGDLAHPADEALPQLRELLDSEKIGVRMSAAYALCRLEHVDEGLPVLIDALSSGPEHGLGNGVKTSAADFIARIGPPAESAVPALQEAQQHDDYHVQGAADEALRRIRGEHPIAANDE